MGYDIEIFKASADLLEQSAGGFKAWAKSEYADMTEEELSQLVEKFYGKDEILEEDGNNIGVPKKVRKSRKQGGD